MQVAVIGAGLQGVCSAIELSMRGVSVDLFEREDQPLTRASLTNEGKIHLGFIFANDASLATARLMATGAFTFGPLLQRWLGVALPRELVAVPFHYLVRRDSMVDPEELARRYLRIAALIAEEARAPGADYFGRAEPARVERLTARAQRGLVDDEQIVATFRTEEIAIDPEILARLLRERVAGDPRIRVRCRTTVLSVSEGPAKPSLTCEAGGVRETLPYDHVVNASWEGRLAIDAASGIELPKDWCFRAKYFLRLRAPRNGGDVPSASIVLGPFGDVVRYASGDLFLSWYPVGRIAMSHEIAPPFWPSSLTGPQAAEMRRGIGAGLERMIPSLRSLDAGALAAAEVQGGAIYARGQTDITDPASGLHQRWNVGPRSFGSYHTVDTGKYSLAPLFARRVADRILGET